MNVDVQKLAEEAAKHKPKLIIIGTNFISSVYLVLVFLNPYSHQEQASACFPTR